MDITIRPLKGNDLAEADRIFRLAFGTFFGLPDPMSFMGDADLIETRWLADPSAALGAFRGDELVGSNFLTRWGTFGFFGPLTVRPDLWDQGVAKRLMEETMLLFSKWGIRQTALFTMPHSPKHIALYQKFGFWPQQLTPVMSRPVETRHAPAEPSLYSILSANERAASIEQCAKITDLVLSGLNLEREIRAVTDQQIGDTVLLRDNGEIAGFAVCHIGKGSEAGSGSAYIKFCAVPPGANAPLQFERLLIACETLAAERGATHLIAGINTARHAAYRRMIDYGFRTVLLGVAMQQSNETGYNRPDCYVIDDWR